MKADVHSHLLPGIDDGARHSSEAEEILSQLQKEGTVYLAFTPHFYPAHDDIDRFLARREEAARHLSKAPVYGAFHVTFGAEVYLTEALFNHERIERLCYAGTRFILAELEYGVPYGKGVERKLERLANDYSLVPILAHVERFPELLNHPARVAYLREVGCLCQVNLQDFALPFKKRKMMRLVKEGMVDFIGEDLHRTSIPASTKTRILSELEHAVPGFVDRCDAYALETVFN